jgi:hypothetical protein
MSTVVKHILDYTGREALYKVDLYTVNRKQEKFYDVELLEGEWPTPITHLYTLCDSGKIEPVEHAGGYHQIINDKHIQVVVYPGDSIG